ncbi:MAG: cupin domain-containing protein [Pseudomonadota bacterium]
MIERSKRMAFPLLALALAAPVLSTVAMAQATAVHRVPIQEQPYPAGHQSLTVKTTVDKGGTVLPHTHPGVEMSYLLEGQGTLKIAGQPDRVVSAGDSFSIPAVAVHSLTNTGPGAITMVTTYVVEKDKPLATPVP